MAKSRPKLALSVSRDIPLDKLVLSQSNVRRIKAGVAIEELAEDIARRTLLQSLTVRAVVGEDGAETGTYEVPSGGRRFRALELLVKQKRLPRNAPVPCIVRTEGDAVEDSLAENIQRAPLHPLDQFRAFLALREKGQSEEEIAAHQFVSVAVVKQRLRLASVAPALLDVYAEDGMTLDQLMAFTVNGDHRRQEQVWEALRQSPFRQPHDIRRMLTEGAVRASDKRARFVGLDNYVEAGGAVLRDLFQADDGGWLQDPGLLDLMVSERLRDEAARVGAEGWRWVEAAPDFPYGHQFGLRHILGSRPELTDDEVARRDELVDELAVVEAEHMDADLPEEVERRVEEIEAALAGYDHRQAVYAPDELAIAGAFVSIDSAGGLRVDRGYVRREDEPPAVFESEADEARFGDEDDAVTPASVPYVSDGSAQPSTEDDELDDGLRPIPDRLLTELTAHRTVALREAVGREPDVALLAATHALCLRVFYHYGQDSCLDLDLKSAAFGSVPGLADSTAAAAIDARHRDFAERLPREARELWDALADLDAQVRAELFAHCVAQGVNAVVEPWNKRPRAIAHADRLADAVGLDMAAHWRPTGEAFFGRVTKARIVEAVRETAGPVAADRIAGLKKADMVARAEELLDGSGWLPEPLRTPGVAFAPKVIDADDEVTGVGEQSAAQASETAVDHMVEDDETEEVPLPAYAQAAE